MYKRQAFSVGHITPSEMVGEERPPVGLAFPTQTMGEEGSAPPILQASSMDPGFLLPEQQQEPASPARGIFSDPYRDFVGSGVGLTTSSERNSYAGSRHAQENQMQVEVTTMTPPGVFDPISLEAKRNMDASERPSPDANAANAESFFNQCDAFSAKQNRANLLSSDLGERADALPYTKDDAEKGSAVGALEGFGLSDQCSRTSDSIVLATSLSLIHI